MPRAVLRLMPLCASGVVVAVALTSWVLDHHTVQLPSTSQTPQAAQTVGAWIPFREYDPGGATLTCISSNAGTVLPPFLAVAPHGG